MNTIKLTLAFAYTYASSPYKDKYLLDYQSADFEVDNVYFRGYRCFTQGLYYDLVHDKLVETCGQEGRSKVQMLEIDNSKYEVNTVKEQPYNPKYFGEGIALLNENQYYAMTWLDRTALIIERHTLQIVKEEPMPMEVKEGWGATSSAEYMYLTDGSSNIHEVDP